MTSPTVIHPTVCKLLNDCVDSITLFFGCYEQQWAEDVVYAQLVPLLEQAGVDLEKEVAL